MSWIGSKLSGNFEFPYVVAFSEPNWRNKTMEDRAKVFDTITSWLIGQGVTSRKECYVSREHGLIMFKEQGPQTMFLLHWAKGDA